MSGAAVSTPRCHDPLSAAGIDKTSHTKDAAKGRRLRNDYANDLTKIIL
jgi:hypothetical protein